MISIKKLIFCFCFMNFCLAQELTTQIMPNYRQADIRQIIEAVGEVTGKNFLVDPRVAAEVTLLSFSPMSPDTFYNAFLATLQVHGYSAQESDGIVKIVPDANVRTLAGPNFSNSADDFVTQTVVLQNVAVANLVPILRPLIPQYGHLAAHVGSNTLIIADRSANVDRMLSIVSKMDQAADEEIEVIRLENSSASEIARMLTSLNQASVNAGNAPPAQIASDDRSNSILIGGSLNSRLRYRALIAHLDAPNESGGDTYVRYLNYAEAETLASNLQNQFTNIASGTNSSQNLSIWADTGTNSLVINAPNNILQDMILVIDKLDIRRAQVKVDAIIVEVTEDVSGEFGVTWGIDGSNGNNPVALTNFGGTTSGVAQIGAAITSGGATAASSLGNLVQGAAIAVGQISTDSNNVNTNWAGILSALRGDAATNIISTPTIVTLDNEEAEIRVGQEVPFLTGSFTNTGGVSGSVNPFQTIQRQEVGTSLKITPQINEGSGVKLTIEQETSSISAGSSGAVDLITNTRTITTSVFVDDSDILVLGGLIDDSIRESEQSVPLLGKIPLIGGLFRAQTAQEVKTNLMVFIRPTIMRDSIQANFETNAKYRYIRDLQLQQANDEIALIGNAERPILPELPSNPDQ
ncbi:MAG: type II secretion system protein GspD [Gammaproteobacteria bacterium TMED78]|nr:MAG: type II secretion system protein GspD [Gammaproteobacteria bacterium TMED78]